MLNIIGTINTHKLEKKYLDGLINNGVNIIRINGAHIQKTDILPVVEYIKSCDKSREVKVLIDLPGNKIRTKNLFQSINLKIGETFMLNRDNFNFSNFIDYLQEGNIVISSDGQLKMEVCEKNREYVKFISLSNGKLLNNKGMHLQNGDLSDMPFFTEKDELLIEECKKAKVDYIGFSFIRTPRNVEVCLEKLKDTDIVPIIKLETKEATDDKNLDNILACADYFLIDRGDLFSEVGLLNFPRVFNKTLDKVISKRKKIFVATQLFASMCDHNSPYLSEIIEFKRLLDIGIDGIQLSEETAVGSYSYEVLNLINTLIGDDK